MRNTQKDWLFQSLISGMDKSMQTTLNMMYHNSMMIDEMNHRREMEQMVSEIAYFLQNELGCVFPAYGIPQSGEFDF